LVDEYGSSIILRATATKYYTLPKNIYQYLKRGSGEPYLPTNKKTLNNENGKISFTSEELKHYEKLATSSLPISFNNKEEGATVTLSYELPDKDNYSKMYAAFPDDNYFGNVENSQTVYNAKDLGDLTDYDIKNNACAKLYGYEKSGYSDCVNKHKTNTKGNCKDIMDGKYICPITVNNSPKYDPECNADNFSSFGYDGFDSKNNRCCYNDKDPKCPTEEHHQCEIVGNTYYGEKPDNIVNEETYKKECTCLELGEGNYVDASGKPTSSFSDYIEDCPKCKIKDGKYYDSTGKEFKDDIGEGGKTAAQKWQDECDPFCKETDCPYNCKYGCCPTFGWTGMKCKDENGECPGPGSLDIIYRPIDLNNPFPGQTGSTTKSRKTGSNWCSVDDGVFHCSGNNSASKTKSTDNSVVYEKIQTARKANGYELYSKKPLYTVELDANAIKQIRKYNKNKTYDNWDSIICSGQSCRSTYLSNNEAFTVERNTEEVTYETSACAESDE